MKALIDNTCLHRVAKVLHSKNTSAAILGIDALALFQFAEHILFTESIELNAFEIPEVQTRSSETVDLLYSTGCTVGDHGESILRMVDFSKEEYAKACEAAAPKIVEDLIVLDEVIRDKKKFQVCTRLVNESARPIGMTSAPIERWISSESTALDRDLIKRDSLSEKALGAFDYTISTNHALFSQLRNLGSKIEGDRHEAALALGIFFRTAINQSLALQRNAYYSPAPQRARIIKETDQLFRYALAHEIQDVASSVEAKYVERLVKIFETDEILPLPMFAIHFLRRAKVNNPREMLDAARKLRDDSEVRAIRKWLNKWEEDHHSFDLSKREKTRAELREISRGLQVGPQERNGLTSILRFECSINPEGVMKIKPDIPKIAEGLYALLNRFTRRKIFLSPLAQELAFDDRLIGDVIAMLGRAIVRS
jgi:hypothetical protein